MDPSLTQASPSAEEDEWDADGFVIPSLNIGETDFNKPDIPEVADLKPQKGIKGEDKIYLGPHGAPPSQPKQQEVNSASRKERFKNKLKEADYRYSGTGRENKVENIRELVGAGQLCSTTMPKSSSRDWLDPHCHESQFERHPQ